MVKTAHIHLKTKGYCDIIDITGDVEKEIEKTGLKDGAVTVFVPGATGGVTAIEYEGGLVQDFQEFFDRIAPQNMRYHHNERWHDGNGFSHVRASALGCSVTIPFVNSKMTLGTWQQVVFIDFDNRSRSRKLVCQIMGE